MKIGTPNELAKQLRVTGSAIRQACSEGRITAQKQGRRWSLDLDTAGDEFFGIDNQSTQAATQASLDGPDVEVRLMSSTLRERLRTFIDENCPIFEISTSDQELFASFMEEEMDELIKLGTSYLPKQSTTKKENQ